MSLVTSSDCDVTRQNSKQKQMPSWRSFRHFENVADVAGNRHIEWGMSSKHYMGKERVGAIFETQLDMFKNILLSWTLPAIVDTFRAYSPTS